MESLTLLTLALNGCGKCIDGLYTMITSLLHRNSRIKALNIRVKSRIIYTSDMSQSKCEHHLKEFVKAVYNHRTLEYVYLYQCIKEGRAGVLPNLKKIHEKYLYNKQISNCINLQTEGVSPSIDID